MTITKLEELVEAALATRKDLTCMGKDPYRDHAIKISQTTKDGTARFNFCWIPLDLAENDANYDEIDHEIQVKTRIAEIIDDKER